MAKKKKPKTKHDVQWVEAKRLCRLNVETVRMAKELGLNPRKLIGNRPSKSQPWKAPVHVWIRDLYEESQAKAARRRAAKAERRAENAETGLAPDMAVAGAKQNEKPDSHEQHAGSVDDSQVALLAHWPEEDDDAVPF